MYNTTNINSNLSKSKIQTARNKGVMTQAARSGPETMLSGTAPVQRLALQPQPCQSQRMWVVAWRPEREGWSASPPHPPPPGPLPPLQLCPGARHHHMIRGARYLRMQHEGRSAVKFLSHLLLPTLIQRKENLTNFAGTLMFLMLT